MDEMVSSLLFFCQNCVEEKRNFALFIGHGHPTMTFIVPAKTLVYFFLPQCFQILTFVDVPGFLPGTAQVSTFYRWFGAPLFSTVFLQIL